MTEITDAEAAEVLWVSDEQGKAAVRAGWDRAKQIGIAGHPVITGGRPIDMADVSAIVYAAHLAAETEHDGEGTPAKTSFPERMHAKSVESHTRRAKAALEALVSESGGWLRRLESGGTVDGDDGANLAALAAVVRGHFGALEALRETREWDEAERNGDQT